MKGSSKGIIAAISIIAVSSVVAGGLIEKQKKVSTIDYSLSFSASSGTVEENQEVTFTASLHETSPQNEAISGANISIKNDSSGAIVSSGITGVNGTFSYTTKFSSSGTYKFSAIATSPLFATGTETSGEMTSGTVVISVLAPTPPPVGIEYSLTLGASSTSISTGQTITLTANLMSIKPIKEELSGASISLLENTTSTEGNATTNGSGNAVFSIDFSDPGTYSFQAEYTPNSTTTVKSNIVNVTVTGETTPPPTPKYSATLTSSTVDTTIDSPVIISVKVQENSPTVKGISGADVTVYQDGSQIDSGTTSYDGTVSFTLRFSANGEYKISAKASSSEIGTLDSNTVTIYILSVKTKSPPPPTSPTTSEINSILEKYYLPPTSISKTSSPPTSTSSKTKSPPTSSTSEIDHLREKYYLPLIREKYYLPPRRV